MIAMKSLRGLILLAAALAAGCGSPATTPRTMPLEGVIQLPQTKGGQVATYRCAIDLATGKADVAPGTRSAPEEIALWNRVSSKIKKDDRSYEIVIEENEKNPQRTTTDWAQVTIVETDAAGKVLRKFPLQEFWGAFDQHATRALRLKDGHFHFFIQFWAAGAKP